MAQTEIRKVRFGARELTLRDGNYTIEEIKAAVVDQDPSYANATTSIEGDTLVLTKSGGTKGC